MRKLLLLLTGILSVSALQAQYNNDWIDYSRPHYKIKVVEDGIYRIPYAELNSAIPGLSGINASQFILFHNGEQVPIYTTTNGVFGGSDYIEFYGKGNDGEVDAALYPNANYQPHTYYSLFNDTSTYFLSWNNLPTNERLVNTPNDLTSLPPKENYFWHTSRLVNTNQYSQGRPISSTGTNLYNSIFDLAEGFTGTDYLNTLTYNVSTPNAYTSGPASAKVNMVVIGKSNGSHDMEIRVNSNLVVDTTFFGFKMLRFNRNVAVSALGSSAAVKFDALASGTDRNNVPLIEITYPRNFNFSGASQFLFELGADALSKTYIEVTGFNDKGTQPILYDLTNGLRITSTVAPGSTLRFSLPPSTDDRVLYLRSADASDYRVVNDLTAANFKNYSNTGLANQGNYLIITHNSLLDDGTGMNWVEEYRQYRDFSGGGAYDARIIDIDQLYDQFAFGIRKHPLAIQDFIQYATDNWSVKPELIFMIGKGREYNALRQSSSAYSQGVIPTFGHPGADVLLATEVGDLVPDVGIGRLSVVDPAEIEGYLNKVITFEDEQEITGDPYQTLGQKAWMKEIIHLGGGTSTIEQEKFRNFLGRYEETIEDTLFGGNVTSIYKTSTDPIEELQSEALKARIDSGVSMITFFGHSAPGTFDVNFDDPEDYTNYGKYPIIYSNGCFAGYMYNSTPGISERFVLIDGKGAVAFLSTTGLSVDNSLDKYATRFYNNLSYKNYGAEIGKLMVATMNDLSMTGTSSYDEMVAHEMTLHGDPALKLNPHTQPDYAISPATVSFDPPVVTAGIDSFDVNIHIYNLGKAIETDYFVDLTRHILDGVGTEDILYRKRVPAAKFDDVVSFRLPVATGVGAGFLNGFSVHVDADDEVPGEISETNNYINNGVQLVIQSEDIFPVYPYEFAIVPQQPITLKASTANPFAAPRYYQIEMDTTELFNSPLKQSERIFQGGGVVKWTPSGTYTDSTVYYWRVSAEDGSGNPLAWHYSSFIYISDEYPGWNQSHYYQYQKDNYANVQLDNDRVFRFVDDVKEIDVQAGLWTAYGGPLPDDQIRWDLNGVLMHRWRMGGCGGLRGLTFAVIDGTTGLPWVSEHTPGSNINPTYGNYHCNDKTVDQFGFNFRTDTTMHPTMGITWNEVVENFIDNIPAGSYILVYSHNNPDYDQWTPSLVSKFTALGSTEAPILAAGVVDAPWIFFAKKGDPGYTPTEEIGADYSTPVNANIIITGNWNEGYITSPLIGPALDWGAIFWNRKGLEVGDDYSHVEVYGVKYSGASTKLFNLNSKDTIIDFIDPAVYPYLQMRLYTLDDTSRTPVQLDYWRVIYDQVPEGAINPSLYLSFNSDTLSAGSIMNLQVAFESLIDIDMDSVLAKYSHLNAVNETDTNYVRYRPLPGLDTLTMSYSKSTAGQKFVGSNFLVVEANPNNDQPEQHHFNNFGVLSYYATGDRENPLLDVTFDGVHIMDGDLVSAKPNIMVMLKDENKFLALDDTSLVDVKVQYPDGTVRRMAYSSDMVDFYPADPSKLHKDNTARVELRPEFTMDGTYQLIIQDMDKSGNSSSLADYRISFEVVTATAISNVLNYPNPFTTQTQFVFTLTGSEVPDYFKIQIMTVKGTVVREIMKEELGDIHIGQNLTDYAWDGTDEYGDPLANGVYFYRVITSLNGEELEHIGNAATDRYFDKGFGKMVLIR